MFHWGQNTLTVRSIFFFSFFLSFFLLFSFFFFSSHLQTVTGLKLSCYALKNSSSCSAEQRRLLFCLVHQSEERSYSALCPGVTKALRSRTKKALILSYASKRRRTLFCSVLEGEKFAYFVVCIKANKALILSCVPERQRPFYSYFVLCIKAKRDFILSYSQERRRPLFCPMHQIEKGLYFVLYIKAKNDLILSYAPKAKTALILSYVWKRWRPLFADPPQPPPPNPHIDFIILRNCHRLIKKALPRSPIRHPPPAPSPSSKQTTPPPLPPPVNKQLSLSVSLRLSVSPSHSPTSPLSVYSSTWQRYSCRGLRMCGGGWWWWEMGWRGVEVVSVCGFGRCCISWDALKCAVCRHSLMAITSPGSPLSQVCFRSWSLPVCAGWWECPATRRGWEE